MEALGTLDLRRDHPERHFLQTRPLISQGNAVTVGALLIGVVGAISPSPWIHAILEVLAATAILIALFTFGLKLGY
jgi:hypothetical protein